MVLIVVENGSEHFSVTSYRIVVAINGVVLLRSMQIFWNEHGIKTFMDSNKP